uniref:CD180 antigen n=1 Tax=Castor canadensis TaxID=51338 RepID=A0A8C0XHJ8_CASCN
MAPSISCLFLAVLLSAGCEVITSSDQTCFEKEANKTYNCENLDLSEIPGTLPNSTESLDFSFNFLPAIQNTTFSRLINLTFLDLTRALEQGIHSPDGKSGVER